MRKDPQRIGEGRGNADAGVGGILQRMPESRRDTIWIHAVPAPLPQLREDEQGDNADKTQAGRNGGSGLGGTKRGDSRQ